MSYCDSPWASSFPLNCNKFLLLSWDGILMDTNKELATVFQDKEVIEDIFMLYYIKCMRYDDVELRLESAGYRIYLPCELAVCFSFTRYALQSMLWLIPVNECDMCDNQCWHWSISFFQKLLNVDEYLKNDEYDSGLATSILRDQLGETNTTVVNWCVTVKLQMFIK